MLMTYERSRSPLISNPMVAAQVLWDVLKMEDPADQDKEHFWAFGLNTKNLCLYLDLVHLGTLDRSLVAPRDVFRMAIAKGAASLLIGHNHPSGDPTPSAEDRNLLKTLKEAGNILNIKILDSIIIGYQGDYYSFIEHNEM